MLWIRAKGEQPGKRHSLLPVTRPSQDVQRKQGLPVREPGEYAWVYLSLPSKQTADELLVQVFQTSPLDNPKVMFGLRAFFRQAIDLIPGEQPIAIAHTDK